MKRILLFTLLLFTFSIFCNVNAQQQQNEESVVVKPTKVSSAIYHDVFGPLKDLPALTPEEIEELEANKPKKERNDELKERLYPFFSSEPKGPDPGLQKQMGQNSGAKVTLQNFAGQNSNSDPPDCNGTVGPNHYMQTINVYYTIYNKTGTLLAGPTAMNTLFSGVPGAGVNDGDPIIMYDEQADRWLAAEFSGIYSSPDYMLIAVSQTNDPTGLWDRWSFVMNGFPDYMKFGVWRDGYYMGTNTGSGDDIYVFERSVMLAGGASPQAVQFNNPYRPNSGFHCVLPLDNDGTFAPSGTPGQFITINDGAWNSGSDQLWIYELDVNWSTPGNSTFNRVQTINVNNFDSNFGASWDNIAQQGTSQELDAIPQVLMHRAQYRNWGSSQSIVCCHAIDVGSDQAGIRWYELENTGSNWSIRQQGTYAPDSHSRWMGSIAMNDVHEIGLGYSVSSSSLYPAIRYSGQSASANALANGTLDMAETSIRVGSASQTSSNRWGDYANIALDPNNDHEFWFTSEYNITGSIRGTRIASFRFSVPSPPTADFSANNLYPANSMTTVNFSDLSTGSPTSWSWSFSPSTITYFGGSSSSSQNPSVRFNNPGAYTVTLTATNGAGPDSEIKTYYIHMGQPGLWTGNVSTNWNTNTNWENHEAANASINVSITPAAIRWPFKTGNLNIGTDCNSINMTGSSELTVTGDLTLQAGNSLFIDPTSNAIIRINGNVNYVGTFSPGLGKVILNGSNNANLNSSGSSNDNLTTIYSRTHDGTSAYFDISATGGKDLSIDALDINCSSTGTVSVEVWYRTDTYVGNTGSSAGWVKVGSTQTVTGQGTDNPTPISLPYSITVPNGSVYGFFISCYTASGNMALTIGNNIYNDSYMTVQCGDGALTQQPGGGSFPNYTWNGTVYYSYSSSGSLSFWDFEVNKTNASAFINSSMSVNNDLLINPTSNLTLNAGQELTVSGTLTNNAGVSGFVIKSTANDATGSLLHSTNGVSATVERYLTDMKWHFIGMPVESEYAGVFQLPGGHSDIYLRTHIEATNTWDEWIVPVTTPLIQGRGYEVWVGNATFHQDETIEFAEALNAGDYTTGTGNFYDLQYTTERGLNLINNPFPSALMANIDSWNKNNIANSVWTWSDAFGNYVYWGSGNDYGSGNFGTILGGVIPSMQGFFVEAIGSNPWLTIPQNGRIHSSQAYYKDLFIPDNTLKLDVDGNNYKDIIFVSFNQEATDEYNPQYDVKKIFGLDEAPQLYSIIPGDMLSINSLSELNEYIVVNLGFECDVPAMFLIEASELESFEGSTTIYLEDLKTGTIQNLIENPAYEFSHDVGNNPNRFLLHFGNPNGIDELNQQNFRVYSNENTIYVQTQGKQNVTIVVYDVMGQEILSTQAINENITRIKVTSGTGYYLVKVQTGKHFITEKVFIK